MTVRIPSLPLHFKRSLLFLLCFSSCYKNHLYVQQEWVDQNFLASSHVKTPDPRQEAPPHGQRLLVSWDFPRSLFLQGLTLVATVRLWDNTQQTIYYPMERKRDYTAFFFPSVDQTRKILTYRIQVISMEGKVIETWENHFWTELIDIDRSAAQRRSDSVSSNPKQGSVIETP